MSGRRRRGRRSSGDLRAEILDLFASEPDRGFKVKEIQRALGVPHSRYRELRSEVVELARAGRIGTLPRRRYGSLAVARFLEGTVEGVGQRAPHVRLGGDERLPLVTTAQEEVVPGDTVRIRRVREGREKLAAIDRVLRAAPRRVFGTLQRIGDHWVLSPEAPIPGLRGGCFVHDDATTDFEADDDGSLAQGWLPAYDPSRERPRLVDVEVLGPEHHPQAAMSLRIARAGWPRGFGAEAEEQAIAPIDRTEKRRSLVDTFVFTIDPLDAKDHDDAVSIEETDRGFVLGVHIADVAAYVPVDTLLDDEARERATSVYPPGRVLPMLPEALSSGECSLHHGVERDAVSVFLHYDRSGARRKVELGLARIRSRASLAYEHAESMLGDEAAEPPPDRVEDGCDLPRLGNDVRSMHRLATTLRDRRRELGSLFVQRPEREFRFADDGHVAEVHLRPTLRSHWLIEEFMLEANRAVAEVLRTAELPLLWRIHEEPDERKVDDLIELLRAFDVHWMPEEPVRSSDYAELFERVQGLDEAPLFHLLALRSLMKARYHAGWDRHFGLAFEQYTHFTSPIRRYPDLHNQRWLHRLVNAGGDGGWMDDALDRARTLSVARLARPADRADAERLADHCSETEREAQRIERDCADICAADAIKHREGEHLDGRIVSILASGLFVELEDTGLDGFVGVERLGKDWFDLDPRGHALVGARTGRRFRLGQRVRVLLEYVDVANGRTWVGDLRLRSDGPAASRAEPPERTREGDA